MEVGGQSQKIHVFKIPSMLCSASDGILLHNHTSDPQSSGLDIRINSKVRLQEKQQFSFELHNISGTLVPTCWKHVADAE